MPSPRRRKDISIIQDLAGAPYKYTFIQTVRLIQRSATLNKNPASKPVGLFTPPTAESIRFSVNQSLSFPAAEIESVTDIINVAREKHWGVDVNFMGLTGSSGVLPHHYTETILQRLKIKDEALKEFFDLFNHRTISLFYQASTKYSLALNYEHSKTGADKKIDHFTRAFLSLIGMGTTRLNNRLHIEDESLIYYSGLLSEQIKTSANLKQILQNHFNVPIKIREFIGQWQELIDDVRTRLPNGRVSPGQNNNLGKSAMIGKKGWLAQGKFSIVIGPLKKDQLQEFAPGTQALKAMNEIVRLYAGMEYDYDFKIQIRKSDIPYQVKLDSHNPPCMGWNTWLASKKDRVHAENATMEISVSADRLM